MSLPMRVILDYEVLRDSLAAWRDAMVMTTEESLGPRDSQQCLALERAMLEALNRVQGCLAVLKCCQVDDADKQSFDGLVDELRTLKCWFDDGLTAARMMTPERRSVSR